MDDSIYYTKDHLWLRQTGDRVSIGLSSYALSKMKAIVFLNLPDPGDTVSCGEAFGDVESLKTVSDLISPVDGTITEVNEEIIDSPELLYESENCWIITVQVSRPVNGLMNQEEYAAFTAGGEN